MFILLSLKMKTSHKRMSFCPVKMKPVINARLFVLSITVHERKNEWTLNLCEKKEIRHGTGINTDIRHTRKQIRKTKQPFAKKVRREIKTRVMFFVLFVNFKSQSLFFSDLYKNNKEIRHNTRKRPPRKSKQPQTKKWPDDWPRNYVMIS